MREQRLSGRGGLRGRLGRPSPAMVVALIALFVALTGTGLAAFKLGKNVVRSRNIKNGQVKTPDLADAGVTAQKLAPGVIPPATGSGGGTPGAEASPVSILHVDNSSAFDTTASQVQIPLSGNSWTQGPSETDLVVGEVQFDAPPNPDCTGNEGMVVGIGEAGDPVFFVRTEVNVGGVTDFRHPLPYEKLDQGSGPPGSFSSTPFPVLTRRGTQVSRQLTVTVNDNCVTTNHFHVDAGQLRLDVLRFG